MGGSDCFYYFRVIFRLRMAEKSGHKFIERGAHKGKGIAVFTSGGDSQVRIGLKGGGALFELLRIFWVLGHECCGAGHRANGNLFRM